MALYDQAFFSGHLAGSESSARAILPIVLGVVPARSVVDVGCGIGTWLRVATELGVSDTQGVDGPWVREDQLLIPKERFVAADLAKALSLGRRFDLAMSLEVAEHLPPEASDAFVRSLAALAPVVLFSAAIPGQGGTGHINERWPGFWSEVFKGCGYKPYDLVRQKVWNESSVCWWYAQNAVMYASAEGIERFGSLRSVPSQEPAALVHPGCFERNRPAPIGLRAWARALPGAVRTTMRARGHAGPGA